MMTHSMSRQQTPRLSRALLGSMFSHRMVEIFSEFSVDGAQLPICATFVLRTARYWILFPLILILVYFVGVLLMKKPRAHRRLRVVVIYACLAAIFLMVASAFCLVPRLP